jgi:hypothetical protein
VQIPQSLPARLYLLAYNPRRQRPVTAVRLGYALRAAALADLQLTGHLTDDQGRPRSAGRAPVPDPVLAAVLAEVAGGRPRPWDWWVRHNDRATARSVAAELTRGGWIRVEPYRRFGLIPTDRVTIRDPLLTRRLAGTVVQALRPSQPVSQVDARDAALVALVAAGEAGAVLNRRQRREHADRIAQLTELAGPAAPALRKAIRHARAAASG